MEMGSNTYYKLKELLKESKHATAVGDEGASPMSFTLSPICFSKRFHELSI